MEEGNALLRFVHKNAEMGKGTIPQVLDVTADPDLRVTLAEQLQEYTSISSKAEALLERRGCEVRDPSNMRDFVSGMMIKMKTMSDKSPSHIAEMMIQGSTMGTIQMTRRLHSCEAADEEAISLARRLLKTEENNIEQMKQYL